MSYFPPNRSAFSSRIVVAHSGTSGNAQAGTIVASPGQSRRSEEFQIPSRPYRTRRIFAASAVLLMVLVVFAAIPQDVRAGTAQPVPQPLASQSVTYGPGWERVVNPDGTVEMHQLPTFQRYDGVWRPASALNRSSGDWPYLLTETSTGFSANRLSRTFQQTKVSGATYDFRPETIKETVKIPMAPQIPLISVPLTTAGLTVGITNGTVTLKDPGGATIWTASGFQAWDSSPLPQTWPNAVSSLAFSNGILNVTLNAEMLGHALYPLYVDPTWTLNANAQNVWSGTLDHVTSDWGDGNLRIGLLADNFNDNTNEIWTVVSGNSFSLSGGAAQLTATHIRATGSWYNVSLESTLNFASCGDADVAFRYSSSSNYYYLYVNFAVQKVTLYKIINSVKTALSPTISIPMSANTAYGVKVLATGNYFEVWWQGLLKWSGTDASPPVNPLSGSIEFSEVASGCTLTLDNVRLRDPNRLSGTYTSPIRNAGSNRPLQTEILGTVDAYNQVHLQIRSSPNNSTWGPWTNVKADVATGIFYNEPDQTQQQYYQLQVTLTSGTNNTPALAQISTTEGSIPPASPTANTGTEPWYPYVGGIVNLVTGNLVYMASDLSFQGKGFVLGVTRSYNSLLASQSGPFGQGWTFSYGQSLTINGNGNITWNGPDGSHFLFVAKGTTGGFSPPAGIPARLVKNPDGTYNLWTPDGGNEKFSSTGLLQTITDKNGNALTLTYSGGNPPLLTKVADATGKSLTFTYDGSNRVTLVKDPANRQVSFTYSAANGLTSATDPLLNKSQYTYYSGTPIYLKQIVDPVGKSTLVNYVSGGKVSSLWLQSVNTATLAVNWQFREFTLAYNSSTTRAVQNARGYWTTLSLNSFGNAVSLAGPSIGCSCDSGGNSSAEVWDGEMNKIKMADGRSNSWSMTYGFRRNLITTTDPGGNSSSEIWQEVNNATNFFVGVASATTFRGYTTTDGYDWRGNLLSTTDPGGNTTQYGYDSSGFLNKTLSALNYPTWFVYNASGWLVKTTDPMSDTTQYGYDILGRRSSVTSPLGFVTATAYDADSRVMRTTDPLGNFTTYAYDARGDIVRITDPDSLSTTSAINITNGKAQTVTDSGGNATTYAYDPRGNVASVKDANQHTTAYQYDAYDRITKVTTPLLYVTAYVYDAAGNRISRTDGNGYTTGYAYDKLSRLTTVSYPGPPVYPSPQTVSYLYDKDGNLASTTGFGYTETRTYDKLDRLYSSTVNYGSFSSTVSYAFDKDGNRATMSLQDPSGTSTTTYYYDRAERLTGEKDASGHNTTYSYDIDSRRKATAESGGITNTFVYDAADRVKTTYTNNSGGTLESVSYAYDKAGYQTSFTDVSGSNTVVTTYTYDRNHRQNKTVQGTSTTWDAYDAVGNLLRETTPAVETYVYDADNERIYANASTGSSWLYGYDNDGNRDSQSNGAHGGTTFFTYDYENRLIGIVRGIVTVCSYAYAPTGEQLSDSCGSAPNNAYDLATPGGSPNLIADYSSTGSRQDQYIHSDGVDSPVELVQGSSYYGYQVDRQGSVRRITDVNGNTVNTYTYDSWGGTSQSGTLVNPFQFTARDYDSSAGLYSYRARFYDPSAIGGHGFLSQDPLGGGYAYASDSPANFVDPSGASPAPPPHTEPCNNCALPPPTPPPINPLKVLICATSILAFIGSLVTGFLGIYIDMNGIEDGLYIASLGWGLDLPGILNGGVANIASWLQLFLRVAIFLWEQASAFVPWYDLLWEGPAEALKLTPVGVAVEAAFLGIQIAMSLPGLIAACSNLS